MKKYMKKYICVILLVFMSMTFAGCGAKSSQSVNLTVSAAASLQEAMEEIKTNYTKEKPNINITYNFGSSGALQQQIEQGAPVDLFMAAAASNMDALQKKDLISEDTRKDILLNKVVLIVSANSLAIPDFKDLTGDKVKKIAIGDSESVPAGKYASEIFTKLGIWEQVKTKAVLAKDVRQVLNYVATENAEAGIVYQTDAKIMSDRVKIASVASAELHTPVVYPLAVVKSSKNQQNAQDFAAFIAGDKAKAVFEKYGFTVIR